MRTLKILPYFASNLNLKALEKTPLNKSKYLILRISESQKERWKRLSAERKTTLTDLIISAVEGNMNAQERRAVLKFIEKQDNIFAKIENNINQFAYVANAKKEVHSAELIAFTQRLDEIVRLKAEQNQIFRQIYKLIANDSKNS
ncbi:hypothetical protein HMPREF9072_01737 [Capnocytophaga sp. oral taxon 324 str. F0483]|nr:hypothetical protein HMPREF9072_01737 [Capnocytophaga sp. oral taxon 324 str. F0483]